MGGHRSCALIPAAAVPNANRFIGANFQAGGGTALSYENFPIFKNRVREGRGFCVPPSSSTQVVLSAAGWPTVDFSCFLWEGSTVPSWLTSGTFKCGFIGTGSESVSGFFGGTVTNVVHGFAGAYTTFDLNFSGQGGFQVLSTGGTTSNVYAYLPGYDMGHIDDVMSASAFTDEAILHYSQYSHIRIMKASATEWNAQVATAALRRTPSNTQSSQGFGANTVTLTAAPLSGATSATLTAGWPLPSGQFAMAFHSASPTIQGRVCTLVNGSTAITWTDALTANCDSTGVAKLGIDGYPVEWFVSFCNACNIGLWINTPVLEDGTDYAAGGWSSSMLTMLKANWTSAGAVYFEMCNENWNFGMYQGAWALNGVAAVKGYYAASGNDVSGYYAYRLHAFANLARSILGSDFGTKYKQLMAWQTLPGGIFFSRRILAQLALLTATPKSDVQLHCIAPYFHPTLGNADSVATIVAAATAQAAKQSLTAWCENNAILAAHWGFPFGTYEDGGDWGNAVYSAVTNLATAILDPTMKGAIQTHYQSNLDCGATVISHFSSGVSSGTGSFGIGYELTNQYASPLTTAQLDGLMSFAFGFTPTRNLVTASGDTVDGINFADNNVNLLNQQGCFALANGGNFAPYGQNGRVPWVIWCTDPRANSGPVTYSLVATFSSVSGSPTTDVEIGDPARGFSSIATGVSVVNGALTLGNITLMKGWNYVLLGRNGTQGTTAQNLISQLQFN